MAQLWTAKRVVISPDAPTLADAVASRLLSRLAKRSAAGKTSHLALAGGAIGTAVLRAAGGRTLDPAGAPFRYGKPGFRNTGFVATGGYALRTYDRFARIVRTPEPLDPVAAHDRFFRTVGGRLDAAKGPDVGEAQT